MMPGGWPVTSIWPKLRMEAPTAASLRSNTVTRRPRLSAAAACARPRMPAPTIATSVTASGLPWETGACTTYFFSDLPS